MASQQKNDNFRNFFLFPFSDKSFSEKSQDFGKRKRNRMASHPAISIIPPYANAAGISKDDITSMFQEIELVSKKYHQYSQDPKFLTFLKRSSFSYVFTANKLEGTCPARISESDTFRILANYDASGDPPTTRFPADGRSSDPEEARVQMIRHHLALQHLFDVKTLDVSSLLRVHDLMLTGAVEQNGDAVLAGQFREVDVFAGRHQFPGVNRVQLQDGTELSSIEHATQKICADFENAVAENHSFLKIATDLFFNMIQLHPFTNGNGRLCRMLLAYALKRCDILPYPIQLSSS